MTVELDHAENDFVVCFRFLESQHTDSGVVELEKGKALAQRPGMLCRLIGDERIAETIGLPIRLRLLPSPGVSRQAEYEFVMAPVLVCLVAVPLRTAIGGRLHSGRAEQRQPDRMIVRLVRAVFVFSQDGRAEAAAFVRKIDPAVGGDFKLALLRVGPLNRAHIPVVSGIFIRRAEWKRYFEIGGQGLPIDGIAELYPVACIAG